MATVDENEQKRRARGFLIFIYSVFLATPLLGQIAGMFMVLWLAMSILIKSSTRLKDLGILLVVTFFYLLILATFVLIHNGTFWEFSLLHMLLGETGMFWFSRLAYNTAALMVLMFIALFTASFVGLTILERRSGVVVGTDH